jgi:hypothetical protein
MLVSLTARIGSINIIQMKESVQTIVAVSARLLLKIYL